MQEGTEKYVGKLACVVESSRSCCFRQERTVREEEQSIVARKGCATEEEEDGVGCGKKVNSRKAVIVYKGVSCSSPRKQIRSKIRCYP